MITVTINSLHKLLALWWLVHYTLQQPSIDIWMFPNDLGFYIATLSDWFKNRVHHSKAMGDFPALGAVVFICFNFRLTGFHCILDSWLVSVTFIMVFTMLNIAWCYFSDDIQVHRTWETASLWRRMVLIEAEILAKTRRKRTIFVYAQTWMETFSKRTKTDGNYRTKFSMKYERKHKE